MNIIPKYFFITLILFHLIAVCFSVGHYHDDEYFQILDFVAFKLGFEIQDNVISHSLMPIDMLRLKLSFFGVIKFDPKSDKWLRITMFQGAPLADELKDHNDQWIYNSLN